MRFSLKGYQADAVGNVLRQLVLARDLYRGEHRRTSSLALTATTGAGKTVMAAAVIEALFWGNDELNLSANADAVVLWVSYAPALNQQTRHRLEQASDRLRGQRLVTVEKSFSQRKLEPGHVYFLSTSQMSKSTILMRGLYQDDESYGKSTIEGMSAASPDIAPFTFLDTLRETIKDDNLTLYMVLDEAHRGLGNSSTKNNKDRSTIVRRLINGQVDVPPMPIVWGISATVERFNNAMFRAAEGEATRVQLGTVAVDARQIQESGLLKDTIVLDFPNESGDFDTVLLRRGVGKVKAISAAWSAYAAEQGEEPVVPLLVLQVPNKPAANLVAAAIDVIYDEWPALTSDEIAHVFGEHKTQKFGSYTVDYVSPERVQDAPYIRVLLAKEAISTGWDCPRAEVLVSFRPAQDETHITQLLGRMIRTPLARRIEGNALLGSVECILPQFDKETSQRVIEKLSKGEGFTADGGDGDSAGGPRPIVAPQRMEPNPAIAAEVWDLLVQLPTQMLPRKYADPIQRVKRLAFLLAADELVPDASRQVQKRMHAKLDGLVGEFAAELDAAIAEVLTVTGSTVPVKLGRSRVRQGPSWAEAADDRAIQDAYRNGARTITGGIASSYVKHLTSDAEDEDAYRDAHVKVAALARLPATRARLETEAEAIAKQWQDQYRVAIKELPEARWSQYDEIVAMSTEPQRRDIERPQNRREPIGPDSQWRAKHLLSDREGMFPIDKLNDVEGEVLDMELSRKNLLAWYRNPSFGYDSLSIAYKDEQDNWRLLRPDFLFFTGHNDGVKASIVDPHGNWLGDSVHKLRGIAQFAESYGEDFHRIEAIDRIDGQLKVLDFQDPEIREQVLAADDAKSVYRHVDRNY